MCKVGSRIAITLTLVSMTWTASSPQVKRSIGSDAPRVPRAAPTDAITLATRRRFLEMFARAYFPGRTGQLLIVPREGDFITRADVAFMHGSPWPYDAEIPHMNSLQWKDELIKHDLLLALPDSCSDRAWFRVPPWGRAPQARTSLPNLPAHFG